MEKYPEHKWRKLGIQMLKASGATHAHAETITDVLITSSLRGVDSHGVRVLPYFTQKRRRGRMKILRQTHAAALLDAGNSWGPVSAKKSMAIAIEMARKNGIGSCSVVNGDWITYLSYFSMMAVHHDMIGMIFAREGPVCAPWGGTKSVTGTNPMSIAIPTGGSYPIVLDFATTISAQGHVKTLLLEGKPIPEG
jgi:L-2-hydroxycarboxylate dehydrogenase (NAD+)